MSFFGLEQSNLEKEKAEFLRGGVHESEDIAVYTWGEESYDGLGDALQERGDELNDETFGSDGVVGECKQAILVALDTDSVGNPGTDFDFTNPAVVDHRPGNSTIRIEHATEQLPQPVAALNQSCAARFFPIFVPADDPLLFS